jgi:hypothetical protein
MLRIAVLSALLVVAGGAAPARASGSYTWLSCKDSTGAIIDMIPDPVSPLTYGLEHSIAPCVAPSPNNVYGVVFYHADGTYWGRPVVYSPGPATGTAGSFGLAPNTVAVCLITRPVHRIACASVVADAYGNLTLGPALSVGSPIVAMTVIFPPAIMNAPDPPICPSCTY